MTIPIIIVICLMGLFPALLLALLAFLLPMCLLLSIHLAYLCRNWRRLIFMPSEEPYDNS